MTPDEFAARCDRASKQFAYPQHVGVNDAAKLLHQRATASLAAATHGSMRLRGTTTKRQMSVKLDRAKPNTTPMRAFVAGKPGGQWSWLESGTKRHIVGAGRGRESIIINRRGKIATTKTNAKGKVTTSSKRKLLKIGDRFVYGPFMAGGSPAKHTFSKAVNATQGEISRKVARETIGSVTKTMSGR